MMQASKYHGTLTVDRAPLHHLKSYLHPSSLMKTAHLVIAAALAIALPATLHAGKDPATKEAKKAARQLVAQYDKDGNGTIDPGAEADALKKAFEDDKTGPLKQFDTNGDGKLDDSEIAAIHGGKKKGDKAGKKAKTT